MEDIDSKENQDFINLYHYLKNYYENEFQDPQYVFYPQCRMLRGNQEFADSAEMLQRGLSKLENTS